MFEQLRLCPDMSGHDVSTCLKMSEHLQTCRRWPSVASRRKKSRLLLPWLAKSSLATARPGLCLLLLRLRVEMVAPFVTVAGGAFPGGGKTWPLLVFPFVGGNSRACGHRGCRARLDLSSCCCCPATLLVVPSSCRDGPAFVTLYGF